MCGRTFLLVLALLVGGVAYWLYTPVPDHVDQPGLLRVFNIMRKVIKASELVGCTFFGYTSVEWSRAVFKMTLDMPFLDSDPTLGVTDEVFSGVPVRVYRPKSAALPTPVLIDFHGGGWSFGNLDMEDSGNRYMAKQSGVVVISVDYRLAPEHPFPAALEDCTTVVVHVLTKGRELGMDPNNVGVSGASAGGNLAVAVALHLQEEKFKSLPRLRYQIPIVSILQGVDFSLPAYRENLPLLGDIVLSCEDMTLAFLGYAGLSLSPVSAKQICDGQHIRHSKRAELEKYVPHDLVIRKKASDTRDQESVWVNETLAALVEPVFLNPLVSPLLAPDHLLAKLPPALVVMAPYDILRDDSLLYVKRLQDVGVEVTSHLIERGHHLSLLMSDSEPGSEAAAQAFAEIMKFIKERVANG